MMVRAFTRAFACVCACLSAQHLAVSKQHQQRSPGARSLCSMTPVQQLLLLLVGPALLVATCGGATLTEQLDAYNLTTLKTALETTTVDDALQTTIMEELEASRELTLSCFLSVLMETW